MAVSLRPGEKLSVSGGTRQSVKWKRTSWKIRSIQKINELPTLPAVLPKLLGLMESDRSAASDIAEAISSDPALASKTLKVANSAYYGFSQTIATLEKAVPLLGFNTASMSFLVPIRLCR
jgi:HD-like signal output (HDOD) protein